MPDTIVSLKRQAEKEMRKMGIHFGWLTNVTNAFKPADFGTSIYNGDKWMLMVNYTSSGKARRVVRVENPTHAECFIYSQKYNYYYLTK